jgi:hypothetical protein
MFVEGMQLFGLWSDIKDIVPQAAKVILRAHNVESTYHHSVATESQGLLKLAHQLSSAQYKRLEDSLLSEFTFIYAVSTLEEGNLKRRYSCLENRVRLVLPIPKMKKLYPKRLHEGDPFVLSYFGDLTLPNNYRGLHWFCENVLPKLAAKNVILNIAGKGGHAFLGCANVMVHGFVDNIDDFVRDSHVVVAPIFSGAGVKIKVLDTVGYGKPLLTTPKGAEGFPYWFCKDMNIVETSDQFVNKLADMMRSYDAELDKALALQNRLIDNMGPISFAQELLRVIG